MSVSLTSYDVMMLQPPFPSLCDLSACKIITTLWHKTLAIQRSKLEIFLKANPRLEWRWRDFLLSDLSQKMRRTIQKLPLPYAIKDKLHSCESKISDVVINRGWDDLDQLIEYKLHIYLDFQGAVDESRMYRAVLPVKFKGRHRENFETVCATGDKELIDEYWGYLSLGDKSNLSSYMELCLSRYGKFQTVFREYLPGYFVCERLGMMSDLAAAVRRYNRGTGMSVAEYWFYWAVDKKNFGMTKYFVGLLSDEDRKRLLPTHLGHFLAELAERELFACSRVAKIAAFIFMLLQNMVYSDRSAYIKQHYTSILPIFYASNHLRWIVLPLAIEVFEAMTPDSYQLLLGKLFAIGLSKREKFNVDKFFIELFKQSPPNLLDSLFDPNSYYKYLSYRSHTTVDIDIAVLAGRSLKDQFEVGTMLCENWIVKRDWKALHLFLMKVIPANCLYEFQQEMQDNYSCSVGLDYDNMNGRLLMAEKVCFNVSQGLDSYFSDYHPANDCGRGFEMRDYSSDVYYGSTDGDDNESDHY